MGVDVFDYAFDARRHRRRFQVQVMRPGDTNMGHRPVDFEELQPKACELLAEHRSDLQREPPLILPYAADQPGQVRRADGPARRAGEQVRFDLFYDVDLMNITEVPLDIFP